MADAYLEALRDYLSGPEWRQSIEIFIVSNRKYFSNITEMDHQQHALWKTFQEIVEAVLEMALASIGGDFAELERAVDIVQSQPSRGPREDVVKDVLEQLLSFSDFHSFATMMKSAYDTAHEEARAQGHVPHVDRHVDTLLRMGFPISAIETTVAEAQPGASLEELVMTISGLISEGPAAGAGASAKHSGSGHGYHYDLHDSAPTTPRGVGQRGADGSGSGPSRALVKFAKEAAEEGEEVDLNELNAKFVIAESVLDSFDNSVRAELVSGNAMHALLRWAEDMKLLLSDIHTAYEEELPCKAMCFNCQDGLVDWYRRLEATRLDIDQASLAGNMLSDSEMRRMAELDKIAAMGSADEQALHSLISRHDQVCKEVEALHRQCGLLVASDRRGVKRESLEELYLFLKQQVAEGMDLDSITDELYERVYGVVSSAKGAEVINLLLDMHVYEDEQNMLQRTIHSMLGVPEGGGAGGGAADGYADAVKSSDVAFDSFGHDQDAHTRHGHRDVPAAESDYKHSRADDESSFDVKGGDQKLAPVNSASDREAGDLIASSHSVNGMMVADSKGSAGASAGKGGEAQLAALKEHHRQSIEQLRELLESEKARKLKALEEKLMRRRALHQRAVQQASHGEQKSEDVVAELRKAVEEAEEQIEEVQMEHEATAESMVSGLKKRCLNEVAIARKKMASGDAKDHGRGASLLDLEDLADAHRAAANSLKERFERDQKALLESLEAERKKQRDRVLQQLAAKRKKRAGSSAVAAEEEKNALIAMNVEFDAMQATALSKAQEHALLALAAMHLTEADLASGPKASRGADEEDEDEAYLDEDARTSSGAHLGKGREWLDKVARVKQSYLGAASELLQRLRVQAISTAVAEGDGGDTDGAFEEVAGLMSKVITDAFDNHFEDNTAALDSAAFRASSSGKGGKTDTSKADGARLRAGILEEFEKAKRELEDGFLHAQRAGRDKLRDRRQRGQRGSAAGAGDAKGEADSDEEDAEAAEKRMARSQKLQETLMERVVDDFLGGEPLQDVAAAYASAHDARTAGAAEASALASKARRESAERAEQEDLKERTRIKSVHVEKEQSLLLELEAAMADKKRALEDRLRRRRQSSGDGTVAALEVAEVREEENLLEQAFGKIAAHLKSMSKEQLARMDIGSLSDFLDRSAQGERPALPGSAPAAASSLPPLTRLHTNATLQRHADVPPADHAPSAGETSHEDASAFPAAGGGGPFALGGHVHSSAGRSREEKESMAGEVKRISLEYNEEKQKLDLMMKIQQARQRQSLQRKLFEKSQRKQQQQGMLAHGDDEGSDGFQADSKSDYNSIEIGANRGLAAMKLRSPQNLQPAFRGLPAEAYQAGSVPTSGGGAGYSSGNKVQTQQSMALRGMNLGPMMRK